MDVPASPAALPELEAFLASFQGRFRRPEGGHALERYLTGLLTELPTKNCATIAQAVPGTSEQRLQELLTTMPWDHDDLNRQRVEKRIAEATAGTGALMVDDTGFVKQGTASVGVARQYAGTLGKVGNCQVAVTCCSSDARANWPVAIRLSLPKAWADDPERVRQARMPEEITCATKPESALALVDQARQWGVPYRSVVADADDGDHPNFLAGLEARRERYVVAVRRDCEVRPTRRGTAATQRAEQVLAAVARRQWRTIHWRHGTKGWLRTKFVAFRCRRLTSQGEERIGWLVGERAARGQPEARKCSWSNLPASATWEELVDGAHRRHAVEQFHEEAKGELGWNQDQGRLWPGCHRHAVSAMLACSVLIWQAWRQRQHKPRRGRPRDPFSPSAGSISRHVASRPSGSGPLATPPSAVMVDDYGSVHRTLLPSNLTK